MSKPGSGRARSTAFHRGRAGLLGAVACLLLGSRPGSAHGQTGDAGEPGGSAAPVTRQAWVEYQALVASDVRLGSGAMTYREERRRVSWNAAVSYDHYGFDYAPAPFDFLGQSTSVSERRIGGALGGAWRWGSAWTVSLSGGAYDGYTDFRSAWLNEYYRQQFAVLPGYEEAGPRGWQSGLGVRWEYRPTTGFLQADFVYQRDRIAPGYEIDFDGLRRGGDTLTTPGLRLTAENVVSRRVRTQAEFRLADTTDREPRFGWQGSVNYTPAEHWVVRAFGGYSREGPEPVFQARYAGVSVEFEPATGWQFGVSGRCYRDNGEIENSLFSSAAPGVEAWQVGLSVRHVWGVHAVRVLVAPYATRYEPFGIGTAFFQNLYRSRDWALVQAAYTVEF